MTIRRKSSRFGPAYCKYSGRAETLNRAARNSRRIAHDNVRIGAIPILRVRAIVTAAAASARHSRGRQMLKGFGVGPIATALVGLGVVVFATHVRAGGDKIVFPDGFDKGVLYTTVDRNDNKQYRELYTSQAAVDAAKKGQPMPDGTVVTLVQYKAKLG